MRTTIDIAEDVLDAARVIAAAEGSSLGQVVTRLARRGLAPASRLSDAGLPTFTVPDDASPISADTVRRALDDE